MIWVVQDYMIGSNPKQNSSDSSLFIVGMVTLMQQDQFIFAMNKHNNQKVWSYSMNLLEMNKKMFVEYLENYFCDG